MFYDISPVQVVYSQELLYAISNGFLDSPTKRDSIYNDSYKNGGIVTHNYSAGNAVVVLGDSHGCSWGKTIDEEIQNDSIKIRFYTANANPPFFDINNLDKQDKTKSFSVSERIEYANDVMRHLTDNETKLLIIICRWENRLKDQEQQNVFQNLLAFTQQQNLHVLLLNQPPVLNERADKFTAQWLTYLGYKPNGKEQYLSIENEHKTAVKNANNELKLLSQKYPNVHLLDVYDKFAKGDSVLVINGKDVLYFDDDHLSYQGTQLLKQELSDTIKAIIGR